MWHQQWKLLQVMVTQTKTQLQPDKLLKLKLKCRFSNIHDC